MTTGCSPGVCEHSAASFEAPLSITAPNVPPSNPELRQFYKSSDRYITGLLARQASFFVPFCNLVRQFNAPNGIILEIGAGGTQVSSVLASHGERVVAMDLSPLFLWRARAAWPPVVARKPHLVAGDATRLPFAREKFDVICSHDVIEHIGDQIGLWEETVRTVKGGGHIVIVGPNMLSPITPLWLFLKDLKAGKVSLRLVDLVLRHTWRTVVKLCGWDSALRYRTVIVREGMHSDEDAWYLSNPIDIRLLLEQHGCRGIRYQRDARTRLGCILKFFIRSFAPSVWIVAVKETRGSVARRPAPST